MTVLQENEGGGYREGRNRVVYTRLIYYSLRGRRTTRARQQLVRITPTFFTLFPTNEQRQMLNYK